MTLKINYTATVSMKHAIIAIITYKNRIYIAAKMVNSLYNDDVRYWIKTKKEIEIPDGSKRLLNEAVSTVGC